MFEKFKEKMKSLDLNKIRMAHLAVGEWFDAWRIVPRAIVAGYGYILYKVVFWYMSLHPYMLDGCKSTTITDCIVQAPTTQHTALVSAIATMASVIVGFYVSSGRKWSEGVQEWPTEKKATSSDSSDSTSQ